MPEQTYQEIILSGITPNPFNWRNRFEGKEFDELVDSVRQKDVIQPILVRPIADESFEIVFGERRWRAKCKVASENGGIEKNRIPALVRELTDDEAFDLMAIENLQREDLTELEEARGFKAYLDRHGRDAVEGLAVRTGVSARYIRRRVRVLSLPARVLKDWESGRLSYGHLEQLMRVTDSKARGELHKEAIGNERWKPSVKDLKRRIDNMAPVLSKAPFNLEKEGCLSCGHNSDVQRKLWDMDMEKTLCHNPKCFKKKVNNHLLKNFKRTAMHRKFKVTGFRFKDDMTPDQYESMSDWQKLSAIKPAKKCLTCEHFISLIDTYGGVDDWYRRVCVGEKSCFKAVEAVSKKDAKQHQAAKNKDAGAGDDDAPRVAWHGEYFREKFFKAAIPERYPTCGRSKLYPVLFAIIDSENDLRPWVAEKLGIEVERDDAGQIHWWSVETATLWPAIEALEPFQVQQLIDEAALRIIMMERFGAENRKRMADYIGIDLATEWAMDEEYLNKKTKPELMAIGETLEIFSDRKARDFLLEKLNKKRGKFNTCKKPELIRVFLESGVDLVGKVPAEILGG